MQKSVLLLGLVTLFFFQNLQGQPTAEENNLPSYSLVSPQATVETHLRFLQPETYYPQLSAKVFQQGNRTEAEAIELAIKLKQLLDGAGVYVRPEDIPGYANYRDTLNSNKARYTLTSEFPELTLEKVGDSWYYSELAAEAIPKLHRKVYPMGLDKLLDMFPKDHSNTLWGLYYWQYIAILILVLICFLVHRVLTWFGTRFITRLLLRWGYRRLAGKYIRPLAVPISMLGVTAIVYFLEPLLQLPIRFQYYIIIVIRIALPFFAFSVLFRMVDVFGVYLEKLADRTESKLDDQLVPLIRKALRTFVVIVGGLVILQNLDVNVTALLAGLSIGGLAVALAAQDTLKNFFGSVMIFVDRPFQIGHWITAGEIDGTVEEVGFRSTRVRTFRNSLVSVPNGKLADMVIDNHGLRQYRRFFAQIGVTYDTPPDLIETFTEGLTQVIQNHPRTRKDYYEVHLNEFAASSLNIMLYVFFEVSDWTGELRARHEIMLETIHLAESLGVQFAFPTQTLHIETMPNPSAESLPMEQDMSKVKQQIEDYLAGAQQRQALWNTWKPGYTSEGKSQLGDEGEG